jgi:hypothetical protein
MSAAHGLLSRESPAHSTSASRSWRSTAQRNPDDAALAGLAGRRGHSSEAGQRFRGWESAAGVADLGQQPSGANGAGARQAGEHLRVDVRVQLLGDLVGQHGDLLDQSAQRGQQRPGHVQRGRAGVPGRASGRRGDPGVRLLRRGTAAVADPGQERGQAFRGQPVGAVLAVEPGQELQAHLSVQLMEQPHRGRVEPEQMGAQLVGQRHPMVDQILPCSHRRAQRHRRPAPSLSRGLTGDNPAISDRYAHDVVTRRRQRRAPPTYAPARPARPRRRPARAAPEVATAAPRCTSAAPRSAKESRSCPDSCELWPIRQRVVCGVGTVNLCTSTGDCARRWLSAGLARGWRSARRAEPEERRGCPW